MKFKNVLTYNRHSGSYISESDIDIELCRGELTRLFGLEPVPKIEMTLSDTPFEGSKEVKVVITKMPDSTGTSVVRTATVFRGSRFSFSFLYLSTARWFVNYWPEASWEIEKPLRASHESSIARIHVGFKVIS